MLCATRCPASAAQKAAVATSVSAGKSSLSRHAAWVRRQPQALDVDVAVRQPLSHCLEAADRTVELFTRSRVFGGQLQPAFEHAELKCCVAQHAQRRDPADHVVAADDALPVHLDAIQSEMSDAAEPGGVQRGHRDAGVAGGNQENGSAGIGFRGHQESVGDRAVGDLGSGPGQPVAVPGARGLHRPVAHLAVQRDREDLLAAHRGHAPLLLKFRGTEPGQRAGRQHHRLQVGHSGQLAAQADQHGDLLEHAETASAQRLWCGGGQDVGVDELAPQLAVEPLVEAVQFALMLGCAHRVDDRGDQTAEILRGFGCREVHGFSRIR